MSSDAQVANPAEECCSCSATIALVPADDWMEMEVIMGFRIWQLMFLALAGLITVVVLLCCFMKCRVPRTKQEIEADFKRKEITRRFRFLLDRVQIEDTSLRTAIEKVNELYSDREKMRRRKKRRPKEEEEEEEEVASEGSSYLFEDEKKTLVERLKHMLGMLKEEDDEDDGSEVGVAESLSEVKTSEDRAPSDEGSPDSQKLSKLSLIQDSPPKSRLSLLQNSPPPLGPKSDSQDSGDSGAPAPTDEEAREFARRWKSRSDISLANKQAAAKDENSLKRS